MLMWRELKIPVTPSTHLFEDHIVYQMENIVGGLADKSEDHIKRAHQDGERSERIYCGLTNFQQSQTSQLTYNDLMTYFHGRFSVISALLTPIELRIFNCSHRHYCRSVIHSGSMIDIIIPKNCFILFILYLFIVDFHHGLLKVVLIILIHDHSLPLWKTIIMK